MAFKKLAITHSDSNANINISHFKPKILEATDYSKGISHKRPGVDSFRHNATVFFNTADETSDTDNTRKRPPRQ